MHIVYFHQHFSTPEGAAGIRSYYMARAAIDEGHEVTMVCGSYHNGYTGLDGPYRRGRRSGIVDGIRVIEFNLEYSNKDGFVKRSVTFAKFAMNSIWLALSLKYDLIFATTTPLTTCLPGIFARWIRRKPFVFEVRDLWPEIPREMGVIKNPVVLGLMSALEWASYRSATRLIALSPGIAKGIERRGVSGDRIALIPNGCDLKIFNEEQTEAWRPEGILDEQLLVVFTGTHGQANGLDSVLDAALELKNKGRKDISIVLIGDGKLKPELMSRSKKQELDNVIFLDPVPKERLAQLMAAADLGLQCLANVPAFYYGTSPNKFFDYIAAGLPVLNNYPGWLADMILQEQCGFVVAPDEPAEFANALERAADDRKALVSMGNRSSELAQRDFDRAILARKWIAWVAGSVKLDETVS
ncbi:MAG: glycosyltransferase family 4 protein [Granulosicoccus sp.]|nr:glycosyltransferase family 4 protein [Granulosicoccus sp.]